ncbi:hypothetical protein [Micromonospora sp. CPCC 206061]|uniref:hypothetical protein n=1 Tax=Micromonospora sp. CPCC 206061 TaxID=3122410 RepID=UPI002FF31AFA
MRFLRLAPAVLVAALVGAPGVALAAPGSVLAAPGSVLAAPGSVLAAPAKDDSVTMRLPASVRAGGSPGAVSVAVVKRSRGCLIVRTALAISLPGLTADQVAVEVFSAGAWRSVSGSGSGGLVTTARTSPDDPTLCRDENVTVRYRVAFRAGVAGGTANVTGTATSAAGLAIGQSTGALRVTGTTPSPSPSPSRSPSKSPSPSPSPTTQSPSASPTEVPSTDPTTAPAPAPAAGSGDDGSAGIGTAFMLAGLAMVGVGSALLVAVLRRSRPSSA